MAWKQIPPKITKKVTPPPPPPKKTETKNNSKNVPKTPKK